MAFQPPPLPSRPGGPDPRGPPPPFSAAPPPGGGGLPPSLPSRGGPPPGGGPPPTISPRPPAIAPRDAAPPPAPARDTSFGGPPPAPARDAAPPAAPARDAGGFGGPPPPAPRDAAPPPPMDVAPPPPSPVGRTAAPGPPPSPVAPRAAAPSPIRTEGSPQRDNSAGDVGGSTAANKTSLGVQMKAINRDTSANNQPPPSAKKKKKGVFGGLFGGKKNQTQTQPQCAGPTNFSHDVHATWDPVNGFQIDNLPAAWKELFKRSGVKKADLRDPKTSLFILETIAANLTPDPAAEPEPSSSSDKGKKGKESKESKPASNIPAPPPPPPPPSNAPAPPPPPAGGNKPANTGPKLSLAEQLQAKQDAGLRSAEEAIEASGCLPAVENSRHMEQVLRNAMKGRRTAVEEEDEGDDWSDEE